MAATGNRGTSPRDGAALQVPACSGNAAHGFALGMAVAAVCGAATAVAALV
jgi:hypothetical protein